MNTDLYTPRIEKMLNNQLILNNKKYGDIWLGKTNKHIESEKELMSPERNFSILFEVESYLLIVNNWDGWPEEITGSVSPNSNINILAKMFKFSLSIALGGTRGELVIATEMLSYAMRQVGEISKKHTLDFEHYDKVGEIRELVHLLMQKKYTAFFTHFFALIKMFGFSFDEMYARYMFENKVS